MLREFVPSAANTTVLPRCFCGPGAGAGLEVEVGAGQGWAGVVDGAGRRVLAGARLAQQAAIAGDRFLVSASSVTEANRGGGKAQLKRKSVHLRAAIGAI